MTGSSASSTDLWQMLVTSPWTWRCAVIALACLIFFAVAANAGIRLGRARRHRLRLLGDTDGTATVEFVLVTPILLFMVLMLIQTMLVMTGNIYVHYAAFAATRSALVQIPVDDRPRDGERPNLIIASPASFKYNAIRRAAVFALVPVSGRLDVPGPDDEQFVQGLTNFYGAYNRSPPNWVDQLAARRLSYADANTDLTLLRTALDGEVNVSFTPQQELSLGPKDPVTVRVEHHLNLSIPYAKAIFADDDDPDLTYMLVGAQYTLTNEGIADHLPEAPLLPRVP